MTRAKIAGGAVATMVILLAAAAGYRALKQNVHPAAAPSPAMAPSSIPSTQPAAEIGRASCRERV